MNPVYIVDGLRTPFLKARNAPGPFSAADLAVHAGRALLLRQPFAPAAFDEVIAGCVMPGPDEANIARVVALRLGCGERVPAFTVQRNCASGLQALDTGLRNIALGRSELVLAGGIEAMSHAPVLWSSAMVAWLGGWMRARSPGQRAKQLARMRPGYLKPVIGLLRGLTDPVVGLSMGQTAEVLAHRFGISREAMDEYALASHQRLGAAYDAGRMDEVEPLYAPDGHFWCEDDGLRRDTSLEQLAGLRPVFDRPFGSVTAGNSAQVTDGAAWLVLASEAAIERHGLTPRARIVDSHWAGLDPGQMGLGPVHAMAPLLQRHELGTTDIDYWEINEAFAAQVLACLAAWQDADYCREELGLESAFDPIPRERLNVDGGGVSLGHPVGASGARIVLHLLQVLEREQARRGLASLCIGGGQGGALLIERPEAGA
ncbi:acetyl-CoA C-acetyltransferase [Thiohalobacter thiocyanaticus]|uniref:Acetyl-CoA C-acetyltransferase n=1 Tax=Thiohalobacter thiocyanaticus TaxID=585455 RepID=A0A426QFQ0_9GAMM|nr:acetyl-CoA C-acetyltransferase [Thiohalobacter thiocyanaticus]RRQ20572.1 acetyl-CoA C-acetyltransferase [Thiohalobacter thiocyanaticus]